MKLIEKAQQFDQIAQQHTPLGLILDIYPASPVGYLDIEDAAIWTGVYLASQVFKFSVTGEQQADENVERSLAAIGELREITGKSGLIARGFVKWADTSIFGSEGHKGTGDYEEYVWKGDVSRDQYMGVFFGLGAVYRFIQGPETQEKVVELTRSLAIHIMDNNLRIIDVDSEHTRYGNFRVGFPNVDGLTAIMALAAMRLAHGITDDESFERYYKNYLIQKKKYHKIAQRWLPLGLKLFRNHINYNLAFLALFNLVSFETNAQLKSLYLGLLDRIWRDIRHDLNSFFNFIHHGLLGRTDSDAIRDGVESLRLFPIPLANREVRNSADPDIPISLFRDRKGRKQAKHALPMDCRVPNNFMWKENPCLLDGGADNGRVFHPAGYLIAYWMGRYYNFIPPDA